jgi:fluoride exporter
LPVVTPAAPSDRPALRVAAIAAGGSLGTLARYGVNRGLITPALGFPWSTFAVNVAGSLLLGLIVTLVVERWSPTRFVRPFAAIGFCGGFTTFSTLMVELSQRVQHGRIALAGLYLVASVVSGLLAVLAGMALARGRLAAAGPPGSIPDPDDMGGLAPDRRAGGASGTDGDGEGS